MTFLKPIDGAPATLLERLTDEVPPSGEPLKVLGKAALIGSVRLQLLWLLDTRCPLPLEAVDRVNRTIYDYGTPDLSAFNHQSPQDRERLQRLLAESVRAYEPRLLETAVAVEPETGRPDRLRVLVTGFLEIGSIVEPVSFPFLLDREGAEEETDEA